MNRKPIFDAVRSLLGRGFSQREVRRIDAAIDHALAGPAADPAAAPPNLGRRGEALIKKWEGCAKRRQDGRFEAYPDPGSADGQPWTIGWGSTGPDIVKGLVWTQAQCDSRFKADVSRYANEVALAIGDAPSSQAQFDALVSIHYNTGAIHKATLTRLHCEGRYDEAAREFGKWIYNDGKILAGLRRRREEEAALYRSA